MHYRKHTPGAYLTIKFALRVFEVVISLQNNVHQFTYSGAIFFPRFILYILSSLFSFMVVLELGYWELGLKLGFWGLGFFN